MELGQKIFEIGWLITKLVFMLTALSVGVMFLAAILGVGRNEKN